MRILSRWHRKREIPSPTELEASSSEPPEPATLGKTVETRHYTHEDFVREQGKKWKQRRAEQEQRRAEEEQRRADEMRFIPAQLREGEAAFSVVLVGCAGDEADLTDVLGWTFGMDEVEAAKLVQRVIHIEPEIMQEAVSQEDAIALKVQLEAEGARVRIRPVLRSPENRQTIPEHVRHEVWRRDRGQCVDCGSRERLEFDHIIPVSRSGANTARNIELRCEACNRKKGDRI
jgi:ribosomal protein L7/L12